MPFRFPQYCCTLPFSVLTCHLCNGANLEIVYTQELFIHQRIIFYFVYSRVTRLMCTKVASRGSKFYWLSLGPCILATTHVSPGVQPLVPCCHAPVKSLFCHIWLAVFQRSQNMLRFSSRCKPWICHTDLI